MYNPFMKLIIQIPAHNEQESILEVLQSIPKKIKNIDEIEIFVLNDGSNDKTSQICKENNVNVIDIYPQKGLSYTFKSGIENALKNKADILVNLDGDNQYNAKDIEKLITPIIENKADITIGARPIDKISTFTPFKKFLQKFGSSIVSQFIKTPIKDATSGFRALNRNAMLKLNIFNNFTYTIEMLIQAKFKNLSIVNVDITTNPQPNRKSRLFKNNLDYIIKQSKNLIRFFIVYKPSQFFGVFSLILFIIGLLIGARFLYYFINFEGNGHIQSLILCTIIMTLSFICAMLAIVGDLFSINRKLLEDIQLEIRQNKYKK